jgi:hypothetical protein
MAPLKGEMGWLGEPSQRACQLQARSIAIMVCQMNLEITNNVERHIHEEYQYLA